MSARNPGAPQVVACLTCYNAAAFVERTLDSLAAQSHPALQVLVSVDFSTDDTAAVCQRFAARDERFEVIVQSTRRGWVDNTNLLFERARAAYVFFMAHDDVLEPSYAARLVAALEARPSAVLAYSDMLTIHDDGSRRLAEYTALEGLTRAATRGASVLRRRGSVAVPYRGVFRREACTGLAGLHRHLGGELAADWPWILALCLRGEFVRVPEPLYVKYLGPNTLHASWGVESTPRWLGALSSCCREIARAPVGEATKLRLFGVAASLANQRLVAGTLPNLLRKIWSTTVPARSRRV